MTKTQPITTEDYIELSDVRERLAYIEIDLDPESPNEDHPEFDEWESLTKLNGEAYPGDRLVRESAWKNYVIDEWQQVVEDSNLPDFLKNNINWQGVADDLATELNSVDFDGVNYYVV